MLSNKAKEALNDGTEDADCVDLWANKNPA
jgi:hypothetical protein